MNSYSTSWWSLLLINRPREDERLSWPCWLTYSGRFTHINGYPSAAGPVQNSESSPVRDRRSSTKPPNQLRATCLHGGCFFSRMWKQNVHYRKKAPREYKPPPRLKKSAIQISLSWFDSIKSEKKLIWMTDFFSLGGGVSWFYKKCNAKLVRLQVYAVCTFDQGSFLRERVGTHFP